MEAPDIEGFWRWFKANEDQLLAIMAGRRDGKVTEMLDRALFEHHLNLSYQVTEGPTGAELTFTPEGDPKVAVFVDKVLAEAPRLETWHFHGRIQRKSLQDALSFVKAVHGVDLTGVHFKVRSLEGQYHLLFLSDDLMKLSEDERFQIAGAFLDHALGEECAMDFIASVDFRGSGPGGIEMGLVINQITHEIGTGDVE